MNSILAAHTYSFGPRFDLKRDATHVLDALQNAGATSFEGFLEHAPEYAPAARERDLKVVACHAVSPMLRDLDNVLSLLREVDCRDVCVSGLLDWHQRAPDDYRAVAPLLNEAGRALRQEGVHLHYHNHDFEFLPFEGGAENNTRGMDILLAELDASAVTLCPDVGWMHLAGVAPAPWLHEYAERVGFLHLRDYRERESVELGRGNVDLRAVAQLLPQLPGVRGVAVEQDAPDDPTQSLRASLDFWRELNA